MPITVQIPNTGFLVWQRIVDFLPSLRSCSAHFTTINLNLFFIAWSLFFAFLATVCETVRAMLSICCVSCLSVFNVRRNKMKLGLQVGLGPGHIVLGGDPAPPPLKGHSPPIFSPYLLRPNGCMDQDVTWYGGRPRPRRLCVRWGPRSPLQKGGRPPQIFGPCLLRPNGWMDEAGTWHRGIPQPRRLCVRWGPSPPPPKGAEPPLQF